MATKLDVSDPEIHKAIEEVKSGAINWVLLGHVPKSDTKAKVLETGKGGLAEFKESLNDGKVQFGFIAVDLDQVRKLVYISWCGEGVTGMKKGMFANQSQDAANLFKGFHVQVNARSENDVDDKDIMAKVKKATGASFYKKHAGQNTENAPEGVHITYEKKNENQTTENVPQGVHVTYDRRDDNQTTENAPQASGIKYERPNENQTTENAPQASRIKYERPNENQSTESNPAARPVGSGPARPTPNRLPPSNVAPPRSTPAFKAATPAPAPAPAKPAPAAPPASKPAPPPPVAKPAPAPEPAYEEPEQNFEEPEQTYEEPAQTYEEPAQEEVWEEEQAPASEGLGQCKALYDYDAENETDLSFKEGDIITILDNTDPSGWYEGELNGARGFFPSNFVEDI